MKRGRLCLYIAAVFVSIMQYSFAASGDTLGSGSTLGSGKLLSYTPSQLAQQILSTSDQSANQRESLVQRYYAIADLAQRVSQSPVALTGQAKSLGQTRDILRSTLNARKSALPQPSRDTLYIKLLPTLSDTSPLSQLCRDRYELVDDRSYAFNLPTSLVLATLDIESSCRWYRPSNGDGIYQLYRRGYDDPGHFTTGDWVRLTYDFANFLNSKIRNYHNSNKLSADNCSTKNPDLTGQVAPICASYAGIDLDSLIKIGSLYNGLLNGSIMGDIQPGQYKYVYGNYGSDNMSYNYDGLIVRVFRAMKFAKEQNQD